MNAQEIQKIVSEVVDPWKDKDGNLIMILHQIQNRFSYVPREISFEVAKRLHIPLAKIYEVITFYHYFKLEPPGRNVVSACLGTACYLKGAPRLIEVLKDQLGVNPGETTADKQFHVQVVPGNSLFIFGIFQLFFIQLVPVSTPWYYNIVKLLTIGLQVKMDNAFLIIFKCSSSTGI